METARKAALLALYDIEFEGAYSNIALKSHLEKLTDERDKALATVITYGVLSYKITLDYVIEQLSNIKLEKLSKYILLILRMGMFQLYYTDKIPQSAAVDESVKLAKEFGNKGSAGFVNAILRNALRRKIELPKNNYLAYSFQKVCEDRLKHDYPDCWEDIMSALNNEPKLTLRTNSLKISREELCDRLGGEICKISRFGIYAKNIDVAKSKEYNEGLFSVQDASPMMACDILAPKRGDTVVDVCAAPGGKTTYLAELMQNEGEIFAFDIHQHRVKLIEENAKRLGIDIIKASVWDSEQVMDSLVKKADCVIADVPCSGLGIARRKPEVKYKTEFDGLEDVQERILSSASEYVKSGGVLVYSTCTLYKKENEKVVEKFLKNHTDFELVDFGELLIDGFCQDKPGMMTVLPNRIDADGFFVAKMKRCR